MFINGKPALDLGGLHAALGGSIDLDAIAGSAGLSVSNSYSFDLFHAERHTSQSNFSFATSLELFYPLVPSYRSSVACTPAAYLFMVSASVTPS